MHAFDNGRFATSFAAGQELRKVRHHKLALRLVAFDCDSQQRQSRRCNGCTQVRRASSLAFNHVGLRVGLPRVGDDVSSLVRRREEQRAGFFRSRAA